MFSVPFLGWIVESEDYSLCSIPMVLQVFSATILPTEDLQGWNYLSKGCRWCTFHRHSSRWTGARCDYQEYRRLGWQRCWVLTFFPQSFFFFLGGGLAQCDMESVFFLRGSELTFFIVWIYESTTKHHWRRKRKHLKTPNFVPRGSCQQRLKGVFFYTSRSDFGVPFKLDFRWSMREMVHMGWDSSGGTSGKCWD